MVPAYNRKMTDYTVQLHDFWCYIDSTMKKNRPTKVSLPRSNVARGMLARYRHTGGPMKDRRVPRMGADTGKIKRLIEEYGEDGDMLLESVFEDVVIRHCECGGTFDFYGVDSNRFCLAVHGSKSRVVFEAIEDEDDGYRSMLECVKIEADPKHVGIFWTHPVAQVSVRRVTVKVNPHIDFYDDFHGYEFVDSNTGHMWLRVGTLNCDDYYPCFEFKYTPDTSQVIEPES